MCTRELQRSGDGLCEASTLCKYERWNGDLYALSLARLQRFALVSNASDMLIESVIACINMSMFQVLRYVVTVLVCMLFMYVLINIIMQM